MTTFYGRRSPIAAEQFHCRYLLRAEPLNRYRDPCNDKNDRKQCCRGAEGNVDAKSMKQSPLEYNVSRYVGESNEPRFQMPLEPGIE